MNMFNGYSRNSIGKYIDILYGLVEYSNTKQEAKLSLR